VAQSSQEWQTSPFNKMLVEEEEEEEGTKGIQFPVLNFNLRF